MSDLNTLSQQIDAQFAAVDQQIKTFQAEQLAEHKGRQQRLQQLEQVFEELREVWKPRMELLVKKFGTRVSATPKVAPANREVAFSFESRLALVNLKFSASTDQEVRNVVLNYDLAIRPILQRFTPHAELVLPLADIDKQAIGKWIDERILEFVQTYVAMGSNEYYLKDHMVEDPIAHVRFPKFIAGATLERNGKTFYFIADETRREFEQQLAS